MRRGIWFGFLLLCLLVPAAGQETGLAGAPRYRGRLSLPEAIELALANHLSVAVSQAELRAQSARVAEAEASFWPKLSVGVDLSLGDRAMIVSGAPGVEPGFWTNLPAGGGSLNLSLMLPLYTGGRLQARLGQAEAGRRASLARTALALRQTAREVRRSFHEVLTARLTEDTAAWVLAEQNELVRLSRVQQQVGKVAPYIVRRLEAESAAAEQRLNTARSQRELTEIKLRSALGVAVDSAIELDPSESEPLPVQTLEESVRQALSERPDVAVARYAVEAADQRVAEVLSEYSPQLAVYAMAEGMRSQLLGPVPFEGGYQTGLVLSWPLYDGGERGARRDEAEAMRQARQLELRQLEYDVAAEVSSARTRWDTALRNEALARAEVQAGEEELRVARLRFSLGRGVFLEILDAVSALTRARNNRAEAAHERAIAESDFLYATGRY
jgi:outer membrane protein TolC